MRDNRCNSIPTFEMEDDNRTQTNNGPVDSDYLHNEGTDGIIPNSNEYRNSFQPQYLDPYANNTTFCKQKNNQVSNWVFCLVSTGLFLAFGGVIMTVTGNVEPVLHPLLAYLGPLALAIGVLILLSLCVYWICGICSRCRKEAPINSTDTAVTTPDMIPTGCEMTEHCEVPMPPLFSPVPNANDNIESQVGIALGRGYRNSSIKSLPSRDFSKREPNAGLTSSQSLLDKSRSSTRVEDILQGYI